VLVTNPIVRRELLELIRTRRAVAAQVALAVAVAALVVARWPSAGVGDLSGAAALQVLRVFGYGLLAGLLLILPAFPATAIVREKVRGTLSLLLNSPMSVFSIYAGKLGGVLGFTGLLLFATLPAAAACYALGGSTGRGGIGLLYAVLAVAAVQIATLGLVVSSRAQGIDGALRTTYALVLTICVLPLTAHWMFPRDDPMAIAASEWLGSLSPVPAVMEAVGQGGIGPPGTDMRAGAAIRYFIVALGVSVLCAALTLSRLARAPLDRPRPPGVMTQDRSASARAARRLFFLIDPNRRSRSTSLWVNPVMVKEFRTRRFGRSNWTLRLLALAAMLSLSLSVLAIVGALDLGVDLIAGALVCLQAILLILFAPSLSAGLISAEREGGGWGLLRMTSLSPGRILRGKLASAAWPVLLILGATLPGYIVMTMVKPELAHQTDRVLICLGLTAVFAILVGATASSLFRSTATATAAAYLVLAGVCIGPLLVWLGREAPFGHSTVEAALTLDPVAAALATADTPGFGDYQLLPANWWVIGSASLVLLIVLILRTRQLCRPE
jgi:ABC-type transport system involved in multi-copper enzyme maturation permease subunit